MDTTMAQTGAGTGWRRELLSSDVDELAGAQPSWSLHYEQLSGGRFAARLQLLQLPGLRMVHEAANRAVRQRGELGSGHIGLALPLALPGRGAFNGQPLHADGIMVGRSEALDLCLPAGWALIGVVVDAQLLGTLWEQLYRKRLSPWIERQLVVPARPGLAETLRTMHRRVMADVAAAPRLLQDAAVLRQMRDAVLVEWIEALPTRITTEGLAGGEARKRVVDRACELLHGREAQPPSMLQVCRHVGASPSKLDHCFRSVLGVAPARYMRTVRLNGVRRELRQDSGASVQDVAARWGFWHPGEFAAAYRRQFGELPSATRHGRRAA